MSETARQRTKWLNRARRILGQIDAVERGIEEGSECTDILQLIAAVRGALNGLMSDVAEHYVGANLVEPQLKGVTAEAAEDLIDIVRRYLK